MKMNPLSDEADGATSPDAEAVPDAPDSLNRVAEEVFQAIQSHASEARDLVGSTEDHSSVEGTPPSRRPLVRALSADIEMFLDKVMEEALQAAKGSERTSERPPESVPEETYEPLTQDVAPAAKSSEGVSVLMALSPPTPKPRPAVDRKEELQSPEPAERRRPAGAQEERKGIDAPPVPSNPVSTASAGGAVRATEAFHRPRRRSWRIIQEIPIQVVGTDANGKDFIVSSKTIDLSRYGAKILLNRDLIPDQEICVCRPDTRKDTHARVVGLFSREPEGHTYGIELLLPDAGFWNIFFPPVQGFV